MNTSQSPRADYDPIKAIDGLGNAFNSPGGGGDSIVLLPTECISSGIGAARAILGAFKVIGYWIARGIIAPCEIGLRYHFGERYFHPFVTGSLLLFLTWAYYGVGANRGILWCIFGITSVGLLVNQLRCFCRDRRGEYWHSYSEGESRIRLRTLDAYLAENRFTIDASKLIVEPAILLLIGGAGAKAFGSYAYWGFSRGQTTISSYLLLAGGVMFFYQFFLWRDRREALLNEKDAQLAAEAKIEAQQVRQRPAVSNYRGLAIIPQGKPLAWVSEGRPATSSLNLNPTPLVAAPFVPNDAPPVQSFRPPPMPESVATPSPAAADTATVGEEEAPLPPIIASALPADYRHTPIEPWTPAPAVPEQPTETAFVAPEIDPPEEETENFTFGRSTPRKPKPKAKAPMPKKKKR